MRASRARPPVRPLSAPRDARRELLQLGDGLLQLADGALEHRLGVGVEPGSEPHLRGPELEREGDRRCCAPSWRSRSMRLRCSSPSPSIRACDSWTRAS